MAPKKPKGYDKRTPKRKKVADEVSKMGVLKYTKKDTKKDTKKEKKGGKKKDSKK